MTNPACQSDYDDFIVHLRMFECAFELLADFESFSDQGQQNCWNVARYYAGIIGEEDIRAEYPPKGADAFIRRVERRIKGMKQPAVSISFTFEPNILVSVDELNKECISAKKALDDFCTHIFAKRKEISSKVIGNDGSTVDALCEYPSKIRYGKKRREIPFERWRNCINVWGLKTLDNLSNRQIYRQHGDSFLGNAASDSAHGEKKIAELLKEANKLIASAKNGTFNF